MEKKRQLIFFKDYYWNFYSRQTEKTKDKIDYVLYLVTVADRIPVKFFEQISRNDRLFVIRIEFESNNFRVFCCFDKEDLIVLCNGYQKKTQKASKKEIEKAIRIRQEYLEYKKKGGQR